LTEVFYGTIKFFNIEKNFGFIDRDDAAGEVFVGSAGRGLHAGDHVSFELELGRDQRLRAVNVRVTPHIAKGVLKGTLSEISDKPVDVASVRGNLLMGRGVGEPLILQMLHGGASAWRHEGII